MARKKEICGLEDHDGTSAHLYTILISKQTYLRPFNTNKDRIKAI